MIGLINRDSSYFKATIGGVSEPMTSMTQNVMDFSITEEMGKMMTGSLSLYDKDFYYSNVLRMGKPIQLEWGYKKYPILYPFRDGVDQAFGATRRTGIRCRIQAPSGGGTDRGVRMYNCNFIGHEFGAGIFHTTYRSGTKADVIKKVMLAMNVYSANQFISFRRGKERITENTYVMQHESHFRFLNRMSFEWGALFEISQDSSGRNIGLFAELDSAMYKRYVLKKGQILMGSTMVFNYMSRIGESSTLIRDFHWAQSGGAAGDNVQIIMMNGQPQFLRYIAKTEQTIVYKLNPAKMRAKLARQKNFSARVSVMKDWLSANEFQPLLDAGYFTATTETTAPQGVGFTVDIKALGNPMITVPMKARFEQSLDKTLNFPDVLKSKSLKFWIRKVDHKISTKGYEANVSCADGFTLSGGSFI